MEIPDYSKGFNKEKICANHAPFLPKTIFCVIAGSTVSGKTNLMVHLLLNEKLLDYSDVYIYSPTLYQPCYEYLKEYYGNTEKLIKHKIIFLPR